MIIAPIDFERLPPLYNPSVVMEMVSVKHESIPKTVSALDAANSNNLKAALDRQALQSPTPNKKESIYNVPATVAMAGIDLSGESILPAEHVNLLTETQKVRVPTNIAIEAYEDAGESRKIATLIIVA